MTIPTVNGPVERSAVTTVTVHEPAIVATSVQGKIVRGAGSCVSGLDVQVAADATNPAIYVASAILQGTNGRAIERTNSQTIAGAGPLNFLMSFTSDDIRNLIGVDGPYTVSKLDLLSFTEAGATLEGRQLDALQFPAISLSEFCRAPIEIGNTLTATPQLSDGYIDRLSFRFPVSVTVAGSYQLSFKVTDGSGADVQAYGFSQYLAAGNNTVTVNVPYNQFQTKDGPYSVESVLIVGQGASAQASRVGSSDVLSR